ncbi:hypothetical protein BC826DRAFT_343236 [Russula brevipes]|nr:hypothetical protein BC826DRAFT_343236 [Russula brevipes]
MSCPLCRKTFATNRITKLHVDRHVSGEREAVMPKAWSLVQHLSGCMRSEVDIQMTEERIKEARRWLEVGNRKALVRSIRIRLDAISCCHLYLLPLQFPEVDAVSLALVQFMLYQERLHDLQATIAAFSARVESLQERFSDQQATITMFTVLIRSLQGRFQDQQATIAMFSVLIKSLQERLYYQQVMMASLTARLQREGTPRDDDRKEAPVEHDLTL